MCTSFHQHIYSFINRQIFSHLASQKNFDQELAWQKPLTLKFASWFLGLELLSVVPVTLSLFVSLTIHESKKNIYPKPWDLTKEGFCEGNSSGSPAQLAGVWHDWSHRTAAFLKPWAVWSPGVFVEMQIPRLHTRPTETAFLGLGPVNLHLIMSPRWLWDTWA